MLKSKKGLMCQDTLGCIKLLSALPCSCDTVCIPNTPRPRGNSVCRCVCVCRCVPLFFELLSSSCWCAIMCVCVSLHSLLSGYVSSGFKHTHCTGPKRHGNALTLTACLFPLKPMCVMCVSLAYVSFFQCTYL